jgi:hypothetical protein
MARCCVVDDAQRLTARRRRWRSWRAGSSPTGLVWCCDACTARPRRLPELPVEALHADAQMLLSAVLRALDERVRDRIVADARQPSRRRMAAA